MIPTRTKADLLSGMWSLLSTQLGAAPRRLIWDNETGIGRGNKLATGVGVFTGALATKIHQPDLLTVEVRQPGRQSGS